MEEKIHVQVKDNSSVERILHPITYISWLLGVGVAHPRKCPKAMTIIIRIIHIAVCSYVMITDENVIFPLPFFLRKNFPYKSPLFIPTFINCINSTDSKNYYQGYQYLQNLNRMVCYISTFYYIYYGIRQYTKWPELMDRLKELDLKIREEISMNDRSIKIVEALAVFITFIFFPLVPIVRVLYDDLILYPVIPFGICKIDILFYFMLAQLLINSFVFDVVVYVLYCRFQTVNKLIGKLDKLSDVQWIAFKIRRIRRLHADICDLASMVNDSDGVHLLFCSVNCFTMSTASLYYLSHVMKDIHQLLLIRHFVYMVHCMQFCLMCWICTLACEESNRTGSIMHKVILNCQPVNFDNYETSNQSSLEMLSALEDLNNEQNSNCSSSHNPYVEENFLRRNLDLECITKEVNDFSIQLQQNRIAFTAYNFFEINNVSFGFVVWVIVTYLILILQLYPAPIIQLDSFIVKPTLP